LLLDIFTSVKSRDLNIELLTILSGQYLETLWIGTKGYASITCSTISNIPYNLIFTTTFNDSSILITIISCDM